MKDGKCRFVNFQVTFKKREKFVEKTKNISFPAHYSDAVAFENLQGRNVF